MEQVIGLIVVGSLAGATTTVVLAGGRFVEVLIAQHTRACDNVRNAQSTTNARKGVSVTTRTKKPAEEVEEVEETNGKRPYIPRLSISVSTEMQRNIRIASAMADMRPGEWCTAILEKAADKAINNEES